MSDVCIVQVLDYEAQMSLNTKKKKVLECKDCPIKNNCKGKGGGVNERD